MVARFSLATIETTPDGGAQIKPRVAAVIRPEKYSQFKYGDGREARRYGRLLARNLLTRFPQLMQEPEVLVASSAFKVAPTAANAMVDPFINQARGLVAETLFRPFKIYRTNLTDGDYAHLSHEDRRQIMSESGLQIPATLNLKNKTVIILDDIRVTGSHERAIEEVLTKASAKQVYFAYILDALGDEQPSIEARINRTAVRSVRDVVKIINSDEFKLNARLCKFVLSLGQSELAYLHENIPQEVSRTITSLSRRDNIAQLDRYRAGYTYLVSLSETRSGTR